MNGVVGVLALQGAFDAHRERLDELGHKSRLVRNIDDLVGVDGLIMPGGESSTMSHLLVTSGLLDPIGERINAGMAVFGTCAGMILLATEVLDGRDDQHSFSAIDITVRRNAYGRQIDSFEDEVILSDVTFHGVFIRAPRIERCGPGVEVIGTCRDEPVCVRQGPVLAASFHPELTNDSSLHRYFVHEVMMKGNG